MRSMNRTSVLPHPYVFTSHEDPSQQSSELKSREHERFSFIHRCKSMEELKQAHARVLKLGQFDIDSRYTGNLLAKCAISSWGSMEYACSIFRGIEDPGSFEFNTMIRGYVKERNPKSAILLYREMQEKGIKPDNFTYPCLLKACSQFSAFGEGIQIHGHVFKFGFQSDLFVQNSLINMYGKCGEIKFSCRVFEQMDEMSVASWSALLASHTKLGLWGECLRLFGDMSSKGCWRADESTLVSVVSSCTHLGTLDLGRCTHGSLLRNMSELNVIVQTSLIDMYVKCGSLEKGLTVFQNMSDKNQFSYSVMISGFAIHGRAEEALKVFADMLEEGLEPDDLVYVGVLTACSYGGLINEGFKYFDQMKFEHHIQPTVQHYGCLVDLMGRSGMLNEAFELIKGMPMEPNDVLWRSLLSACKVHLNIELGEVASKELFRLNQQNTSDYVILSNLYAQGHRWEDVAHTRTDMVNRGLNQIPGFSLVEDKRMVHKFLSQDKSHPESDSIYEMIQQMEWQLRFEGYLPDTTQVLFDVDEEEKKQRLSAHSQKLAIAFGLIHSSQGSAIRIVRNLRMCRDCHTYTSLISKIFDRTIVVRDRNRFHHFKDGTCSCRDYW